MNDAIFVFIEDSFRHIHVFVWVLEFENETEGKGIAESCERLAFFI
jgi:hypothetical protein